MVKNGIKNEQQIILAWGHYACESTARLPVDTPEQKFSRKFYPPVHTSLALSQESKLKKYLIVSLLLRGGSKCHCRLALRHSDGVATMRFAGKMLCIRRTSNSQLL
jgi:hypothetical protein